MGRKIPEDVEVYSPRTGTTYPSWEALVEAESNGWVAVAILRERAPKGTLFTMSVGPYPEKRLAENARARIRARHRRAVARFEANSDLVTVNVKPLWKDTD